MADKKALLLYHDYINHFELLSREERGDLIMLILLYVNQLEYNLEHYSGSVRMAFSFIKADIDRNAVKYDRTCHNRAEAAKAREQKKREAQETTKSTNDHKKHNCDDTKTNTKTDTKTNTKTDTKTKTDISSLSPNGDVSSSTDYQEFVDFFNSTCSSLPKVQKLTDKRKKKIKTLLKSYSIDDIKTVFTKAENSDFLKGNKTDFQATFDWLIETGNFVKVFEGNYDNRNGQQATDQYYAHDLDDLF